MEGRAVNICSLKLHCYCHFYVAHLIDALFPSVTDAMQVFMIASFRSWKDISPENLVI